MSIKLKKAIVFAFVFFIASCSKQPTDSNSQETSQQVNIIGSGSSFAYPAYSSWSYYYSQKTNNDVSYQSVGSSGGITQVKQKIVNFGATDAPLSKEELEKANLIQYPTLISGIVPVINIANIEKGELVLTGELLADIFLGKITNWSDIALKELNPNLKLPDAPISIIHRADGSGTTYNFTHYLSKVNQTWQETIGAGTTVNWPNGIGGKGNEGISSNVSRIKNSIGYVEFSYIKLHDLNYVTLINKANDKVKPTNASIYTASSGIKLDPKNGFVIDLVDTDVKNSWPIVTATYVLAPKADKKNTTDVNNFFIWGMEKGTIHIEKLGYSSLTPTSVTTIKNYLKNQELL